VPAIHWLLRPGLAEAAFEIQSRREICAEVRPQALQQGQKGIDRRRAWRRRRVGELGELRRGRVELVAERIREGQRLRVGERFEALARA